MINQPQTNPCLEIELPTNSLPDYYLFSKTEKPLANYPEESFPDWAKKLNTYAYNIPLKRWFMRQRYSDNSLDLYWDIAKESEIPKEYLAYILLLGL